MVDQLLQSISQDIYRKYVCVETPNYFFLADAELKIINSHIIERLTQVCEVENVTDLNDDVCINLMLYQKREALNLKLSMVGNYAILLRITSDGIYLIENQEQSITTLEAEIYQIVIKFNFIMLDRKVLFTPMQIKLFSTDPENTCVYQALFEDTDIIPF